jgi:hypothetical protein
VDYVNYAIEQERDNRLWQMWLTLYPNMNDDDFMSFEEFKSKSLGKRKQTDEDMMHMAMLLNAAFGGEVIQN